MSLLTLSLPVDELVSDYPVEVDGVEVFPAQWGRVVPGWMQGLVGQESAAEAGVLLLVALETWAGLLPWTICLVE